MADVVVHDDAADQTGLQEQAAHDAAVAEGASAVHQQAAEGAAADAEAAAQLAAEAAQVNLQTAESVVEAAASAEASAEAAGGSEDRVMQALAAQTSAITALTEQLNASKTPAVPAEKPKRSKDKAPGRSRAPLAKRYWGGR